MVDRRCLRSTRASWLLVSINEGNIMCEKTSEKRMIKERLRDAGPSYDNYGTSNGEDEDDKSTNDEDKECDEQALLFSWTCSLALLIIVGVHQRTGCGGECQYVGGGKVEGGSPGEFTM